MRTAKVELESGEIVHVVEEIYGIRFAGDCFVVGVVLGFNDLSETKVSIVECQLIEAGGELFEITCGEPREIDMSLKNFDKMVNIVEAFREGKLE